MTMNPHTDVICRESGGLIEGLWRELAAEQGLRLWLLRRPDASPDLEVVQDLEGLTRRLNNDGRNNIDLGCHDGG